MSEPDPIQDYVRKADVAEIVDSAIKAKLRSARALTIAFFAGLLVLVTLGLVGGADLIRTIHNKAFPSHLQSDHVAVAYESSIELDMSDPQGASKSVAFWSTPTQRVHMFARGYRVDFGREGSDPLISIKIDGNPFGDPVKPNEIVKAFHDVTRFVRTDTTPNTIPQVHDVVFSLDDTQEDVAQDAKVFISILILVKGAEA